MVVKLGLDDHVHVSVFSPSAGSHTLVGASVEANPEDASVDSPSPPPSQERKPEEEDRTGASQGLKTPEPYQHKVVGSKYGLRMRTTPLERLMFVTSRMSFLKRGE